ncbi:protein translocase subunit SecF [Desulfothermus okinawensis JCM 13304]
MGIELIKPDTNIDFMGKRKLAAFLSISLILIGLISILIKGGLNYGIDFAGGINIQVKFKKQVDVKKIKQALKSVNLKGLRIQRFGQSDLNQYLLRAGASNDQPEMIRSRVADALKKLQVPFEIQRLEMVGPKIGSELKNKALEALFYAVLLISIYISGRFEQKWGTAAIMAIALSAGVYVLKLINMPITILIIAAIFITLVLCWYLKLNYALGAVVALIHDVTITVGFFSLFNREFDLTVVAGLLTIIGYSLNDTIVIFDRIRENLRGPKKKKPLFDVINEAINQTLSRTLLTSGTTLLVVAAMLFLGGGVIFNFALSLFIGIIVGTYSSIYIAGSILLGIGPTPEKEPEKVHQPA